jgi:hypothetical protein
MSEAEAIKLVKQRLAKLNYPTNLVHVGFVPKVIKPAVPDIPRYFISWEFLNKNTDDMESKVEAEVDADKGEIKSLYFDNRLLWGKPPPIDVPITAPMGGTRASANVPATKPSPPRQPLKVYQTPRQR